MKLKEFITKINANEHYRIYQPNRDCLIFESYFKVHSPYDFSTDSLELNSNYWKNNDYCDDVYKRVMDKETKVFLKRFGKYQITHIEIGEFKPCNYRTINNENVIEETKSASRPDSEYLTCFNIFIVPTIKGRKNYE